jgi:hypothetical protein
MTISQLCRTALVAIAGLFPGRRYVFGSPFHEDEIGAPKHPEQDECKIGGGLHVVGMRTAVDEVLRNSSATGPVPTRKGPTRHTSRLETKRFAKEWIRSSSGRQFYTIVPFSTRERDDSCTAHRDDRMATVASGTWQFVHGDRSDKMRMGRPGSLRDSLARYAL